jgi:two-component system phosphate regulon response regulator PhoB
MRQALPVRSEKAHKSPVVVVVEDDESMATLLRYNLEAAGCLVESSRSGLEAFEMLSRHAPDLVVLDWMLPGLSGPEILRQLRKRPETSGTPVIMLTARSAPEDRQRGALLGADAYLVKPFSLRELLDSVERLLGRVGAPAV